MSRPPSPSGRGRQDDRGFSLVELLVAAAVSCVLLALVFAVLVDAQQQTAATASIGDAVGDLQTTTAVLQRQVRSASAPVILQPVVPGVPSQGFAFLTRIGADGKPAATVQCVQFSVVAETLQTRTFPVANGSVPPWYTPPTTPTPSPSSAGSVIARVLVSGVVPGSASAPTTGSSFTGDSTSTAVVGLHLRVRQGTGRRSRTLALDTVLAARNPADAANVAVTSSCADFT